MSVRIRRYLLVAAAVIAATSLAAWAAESLRDGAKAPDFTLKDINGHTFKLSAQKGKVVFVNFFATWCPPCRAEFPELVKLTAKYAKNPRVKFVSISVDDERTIKRVKPFVEENKAKHEILLGPETAKVQENYRIEGIPTDYLINKEGRISKSWVGYSGPEDVKSWDAAIKADLK